MLVQTEQDFQANLFLLTDVDAHLSCGKSIPQPMHISLDRGPCRVKIADVKNTRTTVWSWRQMFTFLVLIPSVFLAYTILMKWFMLLTYKKYSYKHICWGSSLCWHCMSLDCSTLSRKHWDVEQHMCVSMWQSPFSKSSVHSTALWRNRQRNESSVV